MSFAVIGMLWLFTNVSMLLSIRILISKNLLSGFLGILRTFTVQILLNLRVIYSHETGTRIVDRKH